MTHLVNSLTVTHEKIYLCWPSATSRWSFSDDRLIFIPNKIKTAYHSIILIAVHGNKLCCKRVLCLFNLVIAKKCAALCSSLSCACKSLCAICLIGLRMAPLLGSMHVSCLPRLELSKQLSNCDWMVVKSCVVIKAKKIAWPKVWTLS